MTYDRYYRYKTHVNTTPNILHLTQELTLFLVWDSEGTSERTDSIVEDLFEAIDEGSDSEDEGRGKGGKSKHKKDKKKRKRSSSSSSSGQEESSASADSEVACGIML